MKIWTTPLVTQERYTRPFGGIDLGSEGIILAQIHQEGDVIRRLVWFKGGKRPHCGVRGFGQDALPTSLRVIDGHGFGIKTIFEGGRLSQRRLMESTKAIDKAMGCKITDKLDPKTTTNITVDETIDA